MKMKCVDLFAGCGGMSLGFEKAGFEVLAAFENWQRAIDVYQKNFRHPVYNMDISHEKDVCEVISRYQPDIIMGGPPCQDFSSAGKRDVTLGRADMTYSFTNIVCKIKPEWFVMENVEQIKKSKILKNIVDNLSAEGYGLSGVILDASYCGVPQSRKRFFLIGRMGEENHFIEETLRSQLSDRPMTVRDYMGSLLDIEYYYRHPRNYNRRGIFSIDEPSPTIRGVNRPIPKGYISNCHDLNAIDIQSLRPLTTIERSYIQTFPQEFVFEGTKTDLEQMIGNAVPVNLAYFVATAIKEYTFYPVKRVSQRGLFDEFLDDKVFSLPSKPLSK